MRDVVMHTEDPDSTKYSTEIIVKVIEIKYAKEYLQQVVSYAIQLNT